jgi:D-glycero-alpha-D-manno-heptose 1-phosphate guanylyltransferase
MNHEALILAGGLGTRLRGAIGDIPKPMAPIGKRPFLEYLLLFLSHHQFERVVLSVGYRHDLILAYFGREFHGLSLSYAIEEEPLGTGGGILLGIKQCQAKNIFVFNGDTLFLFDPSVLLAFHNASSTPVSIALKRLDDCSRYGSAIMEGSKIIGFTSRGEKKSGLINAGVYLLDRNFLDSQELPPRFSFESEFLEPMTARKQLSGREFNNYFIDIGVPEDYQKAQVELPRLLAE